MERLYTRLSAQEFVTISNPTEVYISFVCGKAKQWKALILK